MPRGKTAFNACFVPFIFKSFCTVRYITYDMITLEYRCTLFVVGIMYFEFTIQFTMHAVRAELVRIGGSILTSTDVLGKL